MTFEDVPKGQGILDGYAALHEFLRYGSENYGMSF